MTADPRDLALGLYNAVLQGASLEAPLAAIAEALDARTGVIFQMGLRDGRPVTSRHYAAQGFSRAVLDEYAADWLGRDPRVMAGLRAGEGVHHFDRLCPPVLLARSEYWNEFGRRIEPSFHTLSATFTEADDLTGGLALNRPPDREAFSAADEAFMQVLYPHLRQALLAGSRLREVGQHAAWARAGLEAVTQGIAVLDAEGKLRRANTALEAMAHQMDGLRLGPQGLVPEDATAMANARYALRLALAVADGRIRLLPEGMNFGVPRPSGKSPWLVQMLPLRPSEAGGGFPDLPERFTGAVAVVTDSAARRTPSAILLQRVLGLTPAEADLAAGLAAGRDMAAQAKRRGVSRETLRSQLAAIRRKTGCRRQADLVALILRLAV